MYHYHHHRHHHHHPFTQRKSYVMMMQLLYKNKMKRREREREEFHNKELMEGSVPATDREDNFPRLGAYASLLIFHTTKQYDEGNNDVMV
jgi:hypothetical protein